MSDVFLQVIFIAHLLFSIISVQKKKIIYGALFCEIFFFKLQKKDLIRMLPSPLTSFWVIWVVIKLCPLCNNVRMSGLLL